MKYLTLIILLIFCSVQNFINCKKVSGVTTKFWKQTRHEDFIKGNANNVALYRNGDVRLAPKTETINGINASYVWCMARDQYGNVFAGTGNPGVVYKITEQKKAIELFRSSDGLHIQGMTTDHHGNIYVGTSPNGTIYKINNEMETNLFCTLPELYIWDLVVDNSGQLFAATGNNGKIYRISENGEIDVILNSKATHILDLEIDDNNVIFACSEPFGLIYKITSEGKISVLFDAKEEEVHCLTLGINGALYAGTASGEKSHGPAPQNQMSKVTAGLFVGSKNFVSKVQRNPWADFGLVDHPLHNSQDLNIEDPNKKKQLSDMGIFFPFDNLPTKSNTVYKILPSGNAERILELERTFIFSLISNEANDIYVGTGNEAMICQIDQPLALQDKVNARKLIATLFNVESSQVLSLLEMDNNEFYVGTGNNGSVFKVSNEFSTSGIYESPVYDASVNSKWGRISWNTNIKEGTTITVFTRTGNCKTPDYTWSDWEAPLEVPLLEVPLLEVPLLEAPLLEVPPLEAPLIDDLKLSSNDRSGVILSPQTRFIQYRAEFSTINNHATPALKSISISYLPHNQPPKIVSIEIKNNDNSQLTSSDISKKNDDIEIKSPQTSSDKNNPGKKRTKKLIKWNVKDPDNDELLFALFFKKVNEMNWRQIAKGIRNQNSYAWETASVTDGKYHVKVLASDLLSNLKEKERQSQMISQPFSIDNTKPVITNIKVSNTEIGNCIVSGTVSDNMSNVSSMQYSVDTGDWTSIFPTDQLFDYKREDFQFLLPKLTKGKHIVNVNATDSEKNIESQKIPVEIKRN